MANDSAVPAVQIFDRASAMDRFGDDVEVFREIAEIYCEMYPDELNSLREALGQNDLAVAGEQVHKLKGSAGNFSSDIVATACVNLESALKNGDASSANELLKPVEDALQLLADVLQAELT